MGCGSLSALTLARSADGDAVDFELRGVSFEYDSGCHSSDGADFEGTCTMSRPGSIGGGGDWSGKGGWSNPGGCDSCA